MSKKDKPYLRVVRDTDRLTGKQEAFAQQVAKGSVLSDAYREAYNAENMKDKTIWEEACKLAQHPKVSARIKAIQSDMETDRRMLRLRREEYVLRRLQEEAEGADTSSSKIRALELLGKTTGLFADKTIIENSDNDKTAEQLEDEIAERLASLISD